MHVCTYIYIYTYTHIHISLYIYIYTHIHIYIYIYIYILCGGGHCTSPLGTLVPLAAAGEQVGLKGASPPRPGTFQGLNPCRGMRGRGAAGSPAASRRRPAVPAPFGGVLACKM